MKKILIGSVIVIVFGITFFSFNTVATPLQTFFTKTQMFADLLISLEETEDENKQLTRENTYLKENLRELNEYKAQNKRLLNILELKRDNPEYNYVSALVISKKHNNIFDRFKINKGSNDNINKGDVVISYDNKLIGYISSLGSNHSIVTSIASNGENVSIYFPDCDDYAVMESDNSLSTNSYIKYIEYDGNLKIGDCAITSGLGGLYPKGIDVGTVTDIYENNTLKTITVTPSADLNSVCEVMVLQNSGK